MSHDFNGQNELVKSNLSSVPNHLFTRSIKQNSSPQFGHSPTDVVAYSTDVIKEAASGINLRAG